MTVYLASVGASSRVENDLSGWSSRFPSRIVETPSERDAARLFCSAKVSGEACFGCLN